MRKGKRHALTLIEIMVVLLLIALVAGIVGVNLKGSLDEGRYFRTNHAKSQLRDILMLEAAKEGVSLAVVAEHPATYLRRSGLAKDQEALLKDGWNEPFEIMVDEDELLIESVSSAYKRMRVEKEQVKDGDVKKKKK